MHIPDNYLSPSTCGIFMLIMVPVWRKAVQKVKEEISIKKMPLVGVMAAFSFLIMMFNVPLPGGTTGHAVGAALSAILIGPYASILAVTVALGIQALIFGDGGILAFGANCFNMAFVMPFVAYYVFNFIKDKILIKNNEIFAAFLAGYISLSVAAFFTSIMFGIQPHLFIDSAGLPIYSPYKMNIAIPAIMIPHLLLASVIEGVVTSAVYLYIKKTASDIIYEGEKLLIKPFYVALSLMILFAPVGLLASGTAWGEWGSDELKEMTGFLPKGMESGFGFEVLMPDYTLMAINEKIAYIFSALLGVVLVSGIIKLFFKNYKRI